MEKNELIKKLEQSVVSTNTVLKDVVKDMDILVLLRNVHPSVRVDFAYDCRDAGLLLPYEINEFIQKDVKTRYGYFR